MKCELHDVMVEEIREIKADVRKIREVLMGNGADGFMGRLQKLELCQSSIGSALMRALNIVQALLIAYLTYHLIGRF